MEITTISIDKTIHAELILKQAELTKLKNNKPRLVVINNYIVRKGLQNFDINEFLKETEE